MSAATLKKEMSHTPAAFGPPLDDSVYETVMALRAGKVLEGRLPGAPAGQTVAIRTRVMQTHYKPFARARLVAEGRSAPAANRAAHKQLLYIHVYPSAAEAHEEYARAAEGADLTGQSPVVLDGESVAWSLGNGPGLETVEFCFDGHRFARFLVDHDLTSVQVDAPPFPELVRYVPRKRALFRYGIEPRVYVKCYESERDAQAADNLALLTLSNRSRFNAPRLIAHDRRRRALVMSELPGVPLTALMDRASPEIFARVGRALADLHGSDLKPAGSWPLRRLVAALLKAMSDVKLALPWVSDRLQRLLDRIGERGQELSFDDPTPIHGNLFGDQILIDVDQVGIVDWDDLGIGDPLYDVGRLFAHVIYLARQGTLLERRVADHLGAMMDSYVEETGRAVVWDRLRWHVAVALLMRAKISALRTLPTGWMDDIGMAITEADRVLTGKSQWLAL
ncbi:MAG: phosphotransferase enzyme family protein [Gammaproteobacteria bacterium]